ncbi:MAG: 16S rRNA (guanine(527)-N(7))-methyltransferase RsmG, partial [Acidobacteria bacterium]
NQRMNLTAVRDADEMVPRHFGESLFAAQQLLPAGSDSAVKVVDLGSGAGFPGLPMKLWAPEIELRLIESNQKKAAFLREVVRSLKLEKVTVFAGRAEEFPLASAELVTMRAVERFESALPVAANLVWPGGRLALLIGEAQVLKAQETLPDLTWQSAIPIPKSAARVLMVGRAGTRSVTSGT